MRDNPEADALLTTALDLVLVVGVAQKGLFGHNSRTFSEDSPGFL